MWATYKGLGGVKVGTRSRVWSENKMVWFARGVLAVTKLIVGNSAVGIFLCRLAYM